MVTQAAAASKSRPKTKKEKVAGPRTKMGPKGIRIKDLVHVQDPRDAGQEFTATVIGGYTLNQQWYLQLAEVPGVNPVPPRPVRQSTPARNVKRLYRRVP